MRDTNLSSTSLDCSREPRLTSPSSVCTPVGFFSEDGVLFSAASGVEVLVFSGVGRGDWLAVVWEGCWPGEAGLASLCASACCWGIRDLMISAIVSSISSSVRIFHCFLSSTDTNKTSTDLFISGVLLRLSGGASPTRTWTVHVFTLPAIPNTTTLSMTSSKWPCFISCS